MEKVLQILTKVFSKERYAKVIICLVLLAFGIPKSEINKKIGITFPTLRKYKSALECGEIDKLFEFKGSRTKSVLNNYESIILNDFEINPPKTLREAQTRIEKLTGLRRSLNRLRVWLKKRGFALGR
jgi:transposase